MIVGIIVGITGGVGSGKTTVSKLFKSLGVPVYFTDDEAKRLMLTNEIREPIIESFGDDCYNEQGLNRKHLASIVFNSPEKLEILNSIVHPAVSKDFTEWNQKYRLSSVNGKYVLKEAAILIETGGHKKVDKVIVVTAPEDVRIERVRNRDRCSKEEVISRMENQMDETERLGHADYIVLNNGEDLLEQVLEIHRRIINEC